MYVVEGGGPASGMTPSRTRIIKLLLESSLELLHAQLALPVARCQT